MDHYFLAYNAKRPAEEVSLVIPELARSPLALSSTRPGTAATACDDGRMRLHNI